MEAIDQDSHNRKTVIAVLVVIACAALGLGMYQSHRWMRGGRSARAQHKEFSQNRRNDFNRNLQHRDKIDEEYSRQKEENTQRYEESKGEPQVVWGTITAPVGKNLGAPLRMRLMPRPSNQVMQNSINGTVADDQLDFAFSVAEPREYNLVLLETSTCPGVRLENVTVAEGGPIPEMIINIEDAAVEVTVRDSKANVVVGGQVTVGKSGGGTNPDLFTWRKGLTDSEGKFLAENLTDGQYVVAVHTLRRNGSTVISVGKDEYKQVYITLTHNNYYLELANALDLDRQIR